MYDVRGIKGEHINKWHHDVARVIMVNNNPGKNNNNQPRVHTNVKHAFKPHSAVSTHMCVQHLFEHVRINSKPSLSFCPEKVLTKKYLGIL